ncbi:hypothetical protein K432DRAFT_384649, partial [Lepidopterella palustris CBS 459.81]
MIELASRTQVQLRTVSSHPSLHVPIHTNGKLADMMLTPAIGDTQIWKRWRAPDAESAAFAHGIRKRGIKDRLTILAGQHDCGRQLKLEWAVENMKRHHSLLHWMTCVRTCTFYYPVSFLGLCFLQSCMNLAGQLSHYLV